MPKPLVVQSNNDVAADHMYTETHQMREGEQVPRNPGTLGSQYVERLGGWSTDTPRRSDTVAAAEMIDPDVQDAGPQIPTYHQTVQTGQASQEDPPRP